MQTIARANRVCSHKINGVEKKNGEVIDYYGVLKKLKRRLRTMARARGSEEPPIKDKEQLFRLLDEAVKEGSLL